MKAKEINKKVNKYRTSKGKEVGIWLRTQLELSFLDSWQENTNWKEHRRDLWILFFSRHRRSWTSPISFSYIFQFIFFSISFSPFPLSVFFILYLFLLGYLFNALPLTVILSLNTTSLPVFFEHVFSFHDSLFFFPLSCSPLSLSS